MPRPWRGSSSSPGSAERVRGAPLPLGRRPHYRVAPMRTRQLLKLRNSGHAGINSLFAKAHSADWDFERDVDWTQPVGADDPLVGHGFTAYGRTPTFVTLPERVKNHASRRGLGRLLNILQVGE